MALAIDGSVHGSVGNNTSISVNLTTTQTNDYIVVTITANASTTGVSSVALGAFTQIGSITGGGQSCDIYAAFSAGTLSADTITVTQGGSNFLSVDAFGVSGSNQTSLVWDAGGPVTNAGDPISITTVNANTMVIATYSEANTASPTAGSGFTQIGGANFHLTEYKVLSATATTSCTQTTGVGDAQRGVVVAIVQAAGGGDVLMSQIWL